ncbi:MAG: ferredoxin--NADP(+) reductase [Chloroflexi bacterium]|nr:ferredoxin--NADP(+) reductase [Chloroflexota bacterium]|tara:strand:+ start:10160 stop:11164 length:1005 start_codon:yes stop_codon:yes gene_type:complete
MSNEIYDLTIIGAGPTGLFGAFYAGLRSLKTKIIEALPEPGGQLAVLYPEKMIYDVPGFPQVMAKDLVRELVEQTKRFDPTYVFEESVNSLRREIYEGEEYWVLNTNNDEHWTKAILISAGIGAFTPNTLPVPGISEFDGRGVFHFVQDRRPFRHRKVLIVGGGDTAVDWALNLNHWADEITLIHRRSGFRAHESSLAELRETDIEMLTHFELDAVEGKDNVERALISSNKEDEKRTLNVDIVLLSLGFKASLGPMLDWGLDLADQRHINVNGLMQTNLPGIYAAGDIATVKGSEPLSLIVTGFGQAAIAANAAHTYINPDSKLFPGHSSELRL